MYGIPKDIKYAKSGEIDSLIRDLARSEFGTLVTNDKVQAETAKAVSYTHLDVYKRQLIRYRNVMDRQIPTKNTG